MKKWIKGYWLHAAFVIVVAVLFFILAHTWEKERKEKEITLKKLLQNQERIIQLLEKKK